ncbi:MAG: DNA polymerase III subunit delta [Desulfobacteraceae bacterium]|jgi:DNA polymerase-3 subunit delta|nr:MAG: DNA polymerase III subunit delta [Desulfobacteraceae bacterium]
MDQDLSPETVLKSLQQGSLAPVYLFYGPDEFYRELVISRIREKLLPETVREFNSHLFYCDDNPDKEVGGIIDAARSVPFMAERRLVLVRRLEKLSADKLEVLASYARAPVKSTCLICLNAKPDFRMGFYKSIRAMGGSVHFRELKEREVVPWIRNRAKELGIIIGEDACEYLYQYVGNRLIDLYSELEKISLRHGSSAVGIEDIRNLALNSRIYNVFELMDAFSARDRGTALPILERYIEEEGGNRSWDLRLLGMLNRQVKLIFRVNELMRNGMSDQEIARLTGLRPFQIQKLSRQASKWTTGDLKRALVQLYAADGLLKSGSPSNLVMDYLLVTLCGRS